MFIGHENKSTLNLGKFVINLFKSIIEIKALVELFLRKLPSLIIQEVTLPTPQTSTAVTKVPSQHVAPEGSLPDSLHPTHTTRPGFPQQSQESCSIKQFIHGTGAQKEPDLVPLRRDPPAKAPLGFYPLLVQTLQKSPSSSWVLCSCCISLDPSTTTTTTTIHPWPPSIHHHHPPTTTTIHPPALPSIHHSPGWHHQFSCFLLTSICSSWPFVSGSHPELKLQLTELPAPHVLNTV